MRVVLNVYKVFRILFLLCLWQQGTPYFQNKSVGFPLNSVSRNFFFLAKLKGDKGLGRNVQEEELHCEIVSKTTWSPWEIKKFVLW